MGPEDGSAQGVLYLDGQPVGPISEAPQLQPDVASAVGQLARAVTYTMTALMAMTVHIRRFVSAVEKIAVWQSAVRWAQVYRPDLTRRLKTTKKGRIRKKYRDRIVAWYLREIWGRG